MCGGGGHGLGLRTIRAFASRPSAESASRGARFLAAQLAARGGKLREMAASVQEVGAEQWFVTSAPSAATDSGDHVTMSAAIASEVAGLESMAAALARRVHDEGGKSNALQALCLAAFSELLPLRVASVQLSKVSEAAASGATQVEDVVRLVADGRQLIRDAALNASTEFGELGGQGGGAAPVVCLEAVERSEMRMACMCVPEHLQYALHELLLNALRANHLASSSAPVQVRMAAKGGVMGVAVRDSGAGISPPHLSRALECGWRGPEAGATLHLVSAPQQLKSLAACTLAASALAGPPLRGFGMGLPLARLHARALGGDLRLTSIAAVGTEAVLTWRQGGQP